MNSQFDNSMTRAVSSTRRYHLALASLVLVSSAAVVQGGKQRVIRDKTLVAWTAPANLTQRGGSPLTIEKSGGVFDAIVFGELTPSAWMAGSNGFSRTQRDQQTYPTETTGAETPVQIAIVYHDNQVTIYRNGTLCTDYTVPGSELFGKDSLVLMGLRHLEARPENRFFTGSIDDARIYDVALSAEQLAALEPNESSDPPPLGWWDFENGSATDRMGWLPTTTLVGGARVAGGRLVLDQPGGYLMATRLAPDAAIGLSDTDRTVRAHREQLLADPYRPGYHFVTPEGRCMPFDPNGAIFWKGRYHLFYIFQDARGHNWGHVSSTDLFHWRHHPTGLTAGMFSGNCFVNKDGRPTICYHQVGQGNAMAVALDDELNTWQKLDTNPITPRTAPGDPHHDKYRSWDPFGWLEGDTYYAIFGGTRPAIAKAPSLGGEWTYVGDLLAQGVDGVALDEDVSCADFFRIGDKHMLLCISHRLGCRYYLGEWKNEQFYPTFHAPMSWTDNSFFAPESLLDDHGRRIMWAWIFDGPQFATRMDYNWSGTMSLPRVLTLAADGTLHMNPPPEIELLRYNLRKLEPLTVTADTIQPLDEIRGTSLELNLELAATSAARYGVKVCAAPDGSEQTLVHYDSQAQKLVIDTCKSSLTDSPQTVEAGPLALAPGEPLRLRVFVDKSVVEVFANGRQAVMRRIYPSRPDSLEVALFSEGGPTQATTLEAWDLMPSNPY